MFHRPRRILARTAPKSQGNRVGIANILGFSAFRCSGAPAVSSLDLNGVGPQAREETKMRKNRKEKKAKEETERERATLAERLLASLDDLPEAEAERLWVEEAQSRLEDYRAGRATAIDSKDVHTKANRLLQ